MTKELFISQTFGECRAALTENGEILDFLMDRAGDNSEDNYLVGNIYKGKVLKVLPGMQSAFVDIGHKKAAFLYVEDAYIPSLEEQKEVSEREGAGSVDDLEEDKSRAGKIIPDEFSTLSDHVKKRFRSKRSIETFLKDGSEILVQITKEPIATKGPRITRYVTLAGRYVVFIPFIEHIGVSRRIENAGERSRLKDILDRIQSGKEGIIARTVAEGQSYKTLKSDYTMLVNIWQEAIKRAEKAQAPELCYKDLNFVHRVLRDITDEDISKITLDNKKHLKEAEKFIDKVNPSFKGNLELYKGGIPLFEKMGLDMEIERSLSNKVFLRSGGSLNIEQTEALVSIDVNTEKFVGRKNLEETVFRTNLEAAKEIAYQMRLRNCGGIIIIDFIDMEKKEHRNQVYNSLLEALKKDRAKTNVLPISALGLVEMTRKRTRDTLIRVMCTPCPYCEGSGVVKSILTVCCDLMRELEKILKQRDTGSKVNVYAHPEVTAQLVGTNLDMIESLEEKFGKNIIIRSENNYHIEQYEIFPQQN